MCINVVAVFSQHHYRTMFSYHTTRLYNNDVSHLNGSSALLFISYHMNRGRSAARRGAVRSALFWRAADGCIRECCFALVEYLLYTRMRSNFKTAPNIGEVSLMAAIGPLLEWNVPVLPMASRRSQAPQTSGPYCLCHPFPPTSDARPCLWALCLSTGVWLHSAHVVF